MSSSYAWMLVGRDITDDCQECQEKHEKCISDRDWWRQKANDYQAELHRRAEVEDKAHAGTLADLCFDACGSAMQDAARWRKRARKWKRIARDREDHLTEECAAAEINADAWKKTAIRWSEEQNAQILELQARLRGECQGEEPCAGELAYRAERKRARKWKRRVLWWRKTCEGCQAETERDEARADAKRWAIEAEDELRSSTRVVDERDEARADLAQAVKDFEMILAENTNLHTELDALRVRARGMREALMHLAPRNEYGDLTYGGRAMICAAGEPIP